jgi:tubulin polyglutamylase TTLL1
MKSRLLRDVLELAVTNDAVDQRRSFQTPELSATNGFEWLINEASALEAEKLHKKTSRKNATQWR